MFAIHRNVCWQKWNWIWINQKPIYAWIYTPLKDPNLSRYTDGEQWLLILIACKQSRVPMCHLWQCEWAQIRERCKRRRQRLEACKRSEWTVGDIVTHAIRQYSLIRLPNAKRRAQRYKWLQYPSGYCVRTIAMYLYVAQRIHFAHRTHWPHSCTNEKYSQFTIHRKNK